MTNRIMGLRYHLDALLTVCVYGMVFCFVLFSNLHSFEFDLPPSSFEICLRRKTNLRKSLLFSFFLFFFVKQI